MNVEITIHEINVAITAMYKTHPYTVTAHQSADSQLSTPKRRTSPTSSSSLQGAVCRRRNMLLGLGMLGIFPARVAEATGLESINLPEIEQPQALKEWQSKNQETLNRAEESFQNSDLLKKLKEKTEENKESRKKELTDRYCLRQAELGVGDCAGLRLIPGATKSGVQEKPAWLKKLIGESD